MLDVNANLGLMQIPSESEANTFAVVACHRTYPLSARCLQLLAVVMLVEGGEDRPTYAIQ
jgi:hypothetical protein